MQVFLAASLRRHVPGYSGAIGLAVDMEPARTIAEVAAGLATPRDEVKLIMVNGVGSGWDTPLKGDERVGLSLPLEEADPGCRRDARPKISRDFFSGYYSPIASFNFRTLSSSSPKRSSEMVSPFFEGWYSPSSPL